MASGGRLRRNRINFRHEIDGLRAVAVSTAVLFHAGIGGAGYGGVDVFFVISGYLIAAVLLAEHADSGRICIGGFYAQRVRRNLPASMFVLLATLCLSSLLLSTASAAQVAESAIASFLFSSNFFLQAATGEYFVPQF